MISVSLRWQTTFWCSMFIVTLFVLMAHGCEEYSKSGYRCIPIFGEKFPLISTIITGEFRSRLFVLMSVGIMIGAVEKNARAFYKLFHGVITPRRNKLMMGLVLISIICLPLLGVYDVKTYKYSHRFFA